MRHALCSLLAVALGASSFAAPAATPAGVSVDDFIKRDTFRQLKISPNGNYLAATVPLEDRTAMVILERASNKVVSTFSLSKDTHIADFDWVNPERVLIAVAQSQGQLDEPTITGELFAINADGKRAETLVGYRASSGTGTRIKPREPERVYAELVDDLPADDRNVIVSISPWAADPFTRAEQMDVYTGRRQVVARVPVRRAQFTTDHAGVVRFARGVGDGNESKLLYRASRDAEWVEINDENKTGRVESVIGFDPDGRIAYFNSDNPQGTDAVVAYDTVSGERRELLRDDKVDPAFPIFQTGADRAPVGVAFLGGPQRLAFFDEASADAKLYRGLEKAFPGQAVLVTSTTQDGRHALVQVDSATNPGDFYTFDRTNRRADHIVSRREWFDPEAMAEVRPVSFPARDGLLLTGFVTRPRGAGDQPLPTVVLVHGGPFGVFDEWTFEDEVQMLAQSGYAVLQVNFRGSGNRGRRFQQAGARQWGQAMQDDVTDATRWAIAEGIADAGRICIYGASYGAYASLMGVAREPALYRCAAGYVGVYDLDKRHHEYGQTSDSAKVWVDEWMGPSGSFAGRSPTDLADRIKVPVFLAAGGQDYIAPIEHTEAMEKAIKRAGGSVETLYYPTEGHGFYTESRRREYYTRLLAFFASHLGGTGAAVASAGKE